MCSLLLVDAPVSRVHRELFVYKIRTIHINPAQPRHPPRQRGVPRAVKTMQVYLMVSRDPSRGVLLYRRLISSLER